MNEAAWLKKMVKSITKGLSKYNGNAHEEGGVSKKKKERAGVLLRVLSTGLDMNPRRNMLSDKWWMGVIIQKSMFFLIIEFHNVDVNPLTLYI